MESAVAGIEPAEPKAKSGFAFCAFADNVLAQDFQVVEELGQVAAEVLLVAELVQVVAESARVVELAQVVAELAQVAVAALQEAELEQVVAESGWVVAELGQDVSDPEQVPAESVE